MNTDRYIDTFMNMHSTHGVVPVWRNGGQHSRNRNTVGQRLHLTPPHLAQIDIFHPRLLSKMAPNPSESDGFPPRI